MHLPDHHLIVPRSLSLPFCSRSCGTPASTFSIATYALSTASAPRIPARGDQRMGAGTCSRKSAVDGGGTIRKYFPSGDRLHYPQEKPYHFGTQVDIST